MLINKIKIFRTLIANALLITPFVAHADLTIENRTNEPSTSIVNARACSSTIPVYGITPPTSVSMVRYWPTLYLACVGNLEACQAVVYMTDNCMGEAIAILTLNTKTGESSVIAGNNNKYKLTAIGMNVVLDYA